ncbi:MAG: hypothetical protein VYD64_07140 [Pseudomonadota bacterium]|nr:hypothetical protein [Pseudomonadota bacterium]
MSVDENEPFRVVRPTAYSMGKLAKMNRIWSETAFHLSTLHSSQPPARLFSGQIIRSLQLVNRAGPDLARGLITMMDHGDGLPVTHP